MTLSNLKYAKNGYIYCPCKNKWHHRQHQIIWKLSKDNQYHQIKVTKVEIRNSKVIMRKDKPDIEKKVTEFNSKLSKSCSKNKIDIIENENVDGSCLSFKKLHLNKKGHFYLANNFLDFLHSFWFGKSLPASPKTLVSSLEGLYNLRAFYPKNIILSYINVNSIRNKLDDLKFLLGKSLDIICISETKLDETFPTAQFAIEGFNKSYLLDITSNSGGLLLYVKANLPSKLIINRFYHFPNEIQCIPIELNISTKNYAYRIKISISS